MNDQTFSFALTNALLSFAAVLRDVLKGVMSAPPGS